MLLHASKFPSPQKMSQIPLFSPKRCNAPPFLLSILYKTSFLFHIFCFIIHAINRFLVVLNIFHASSKLNAAIFWFSNPFHYIFLLLFRQKAARGVREGFRRQKSQCATCEKDSRRQKGARRTRRGSAGKRVSARRVRRIPAGKSGGAQRARMGSAGKRVSARRARRIPAGKKQRAACERDSRRQKGARSVREGFPQDKPTPSDIICQRASLFVSFH